MYFGLINYAIQKIIYSLSLWNFYFLQKSKMPEELTLDLDSALDLANPTYSYESMLNYAWISTGGYVESCVLLLWTIICRWRMFQKAGLPGWWAIIPFYNIYLRFKMAGMSGWWVLSLLFPPLFLIVFIVSFFKVPQRFGKHWAWGFGLWFLNPIFIGILAFNKSNYK